MMKITRMTTVVKEEVIRSWRLRGRTGWSSFGRAVKKEEVGGAKAETKAGRTVQDVGSAARPSITGPCGTKKSTTTMAVAAAARRMRICRGVRSKA